MAFDRHQAVGILAFLHQRADDIGLPPGLQFLADKGVQTAALAFRHQPGLDRLTARGQLIDHAHIQIAEQAQRQRTRNRRGGHDQQVRRAPGGRVAAFFQKGRALGHAETVLLVRNAQAQMLKTHAAADQGVGADHRLPSALPNGFQRFPPFLRRHAADQQAAAAAVFFEKGSHGFHMLPGQNLRGSHQGALIAALSGQQHGPHGHGGLAAAHVPLHHPGHGIGRRALHFHIPGDLRKGTALRVRRRKGQRSPEGLLPPGWNFHGQSAPAQPTHHADARLIHQHLLKGQPSLSRWDFVHGLRRMQAAQSFAQGQQLIALHQRQGQGFRADLVQRFQRFPDDLLMHPLGQSLNGPVQGHDARILFQRRVHQLQPSAPALHRAAQQKAGAPVQIFLHPRLIEPAGAQLAAFVGKSAGDKRHFPLEAGQLRFPLPNQRKALPLPCLRPGGGRNGAAVPVFLGNGIQKITQRDDSRCV